MTAKLVLCLLSIKMGKFFSCLLPPYFLLLPEFSLSSPWPEFSPAETSSVAAGSILCVCTEPSVLMGDQQASELMQSERQQQGLGMWETGWMFSKLQAVSPARILPSNLALSFCCLNGDLVQSLQYSFYSVFPCLSLWALSFLISVSHFSVQPLSCLSSPERPSKCCSYLLLS